MQSLWRQVLRLHFPILTIPDKYVLGCGEAQAPISTVRSIVLCHEANVHPRLIVTFDMQSSNGQVAMAIYEWKDVKYLGVVTSNTDYSLPVSFSSVVM